MAGLMGPSDVTTTNKIEMSPEQKELLKVAMPYYRQFADQGVTLPKGSGIIPMNALQQKSQQMVLGGAQDQQQTVNKAQNFNDFLFSGDVLKAKSNPYLKGTMDAATRPLFEGLTEQIMPSIRGAATEAGQFGSSRQGIAEAGAVNATQRAAADATSKIGFDAYNAGLEATTKANAMLPQTLQAYQMPAMGVGTVGDIQRQFSQMMLDEQRNRFLQEQMLPVNIGHELMGAVGSIPSAGSSSTTQGPGTNPLSAILGIGSLFMGGGGGGLTSMLGFL